METRRPVKYMDRWACLRQQGLIFNTVRTAIQAFTILVLFKIAYYFYIEDLSNVKIEGSLILLALVIGLLNYIIHEIFYNKIFKK